MDIARIAMSWYLYLHVRRLFIMEVHTLHM